MDFSKINIDGNEYNVKDEQARNNIDSLKNEMTNVKLLNGECEFIYPGKWGTNTTYSGNSSLIKVEDKVLLFDTNLAEVYSDLKIMFEENNVTHLDYVVITHFDLDHMENLESLMLDKFIDNNTKYIHPNCITPIYSQGTKDWYDNFENLCNLEGIESIVPTENQIINVTDNFSMRFGNLNTEYALANYSNANHASMIIEVKHNNFYALFMGDALKETEKYLVDTNFIRNEINLYHIPHHAIEEECYMPFYELINPKFAVTQAQDGHYNLNLFTTNQSSALLSDKGCVNYFSFNNDTNIRFIEKDGNIECVQGKSIPHAGQAYKTIEIYCDSVNFNPEKQDGTEQYPYKDLPQALGMTRDWNNQNILIKLKPGTYGTAYTGTNAKQKNTCNISNRKNYIAIQGDSRTNTFIENGLTINNCFNVFIRNLTIRPDPRNNMGIYIIASKALVVDCSFEGKNNETFEGKAFHTAISADITTTRCRFSNLDTAYYVRGGTKLKTFDDNIRNLNYYINFDNNNEINIGQISSNSDLSTVVNITHPDSNDMTIFPNPSRYTLSITDKMLGEIQLPFKPQNRIYTSLVIHYTFNFNNEYAGRGKRIIPFRNVTALLISEVNATINNTLNAFSLVINLIDDMFTIVRNDCTTVAPNGTLTMHSAANATDKSYGIEITEIDFI